MGMAYAYIKVVTRLHKVGLVLGLVQKTPPLPYSDLRVICGSTILRFSIYGAQRGLCLTWLLSDSFKYCDLRTAVAWGE